LVWKIRYNNYNTKISIDIFSENYDTKFLQQKQGDIYLIWLFGEYSNNYLEYLPKLFLIFS